MPNTVARPATLGACQVRLQLSMLFEPMTTRANFWAAKFISFVLFEQLKSPNDVGPWRSTTALKPVAARSSASAHDARRSGAPRRSRTSGWVTRACLRILGRM
jgi:hypothetical protein